MPSLRYDDCAECRRQMWKHELVASPRVGETGQKYERVTRARPQVDVREADACLDLYLSRSGTHARGDVLSFGTYRFRFLVVGIVVALTMRPALSYVFHSPICSPPWKLPDLIKEPSLRKNSQ